MIVLRGGITSRSLNLNPTSRSFCESAQSAHMATTMNGYAKVAHLMAKYEEFAILKRFKALNYQSLLYRQAEITHLQEDLEKLVERDAADPTRQHYTKDWWALAHTETKQEGGDQWRKVQQIRKKLEDYSTGNEDPRQTWCHQICSRGIPDDQLLKMAALAKLDGPAPPDLKFLRDWFERRDMGFFPIWGLDKDSWEDDGDLIAVKPRLLQDPVTRLFEALISLFHRFLGEKLKVRKFSLRTPLSDYQQKTNT